MGGTVVKMLVESSLSDAGPSHSDASEPVWLFSKELFSA
jgi:hypothetical protein